MVYESRLKIPSSKLTKIDICLMQVYLQIKSRTRKKSTRIYIESSEKKYWNNFQEQDFLRDLNFPLFSSVLLSREEKGGIFNLVL